MSTPTPAHRVDFGRPRLTIRRGPLATQLDPRSITVCTVMLLVSAALVITALMVGDYPLSLDDVLGAVTGAEDGIVRTVVIEWRLPRAVAAVTFGAALGASGAIFQSLTRNPLASPDIIGLSTGSYTGALVVIIVIGGGYAQIAAGALAGGLATAAAIYLLAYRRGVQGFRLIVTGIGISAMLTSVNTWLMLRADFEVAMTAAVWGAGSLNGISWQQASTASVAIVVLLTGAATLTAAMRQLELGADTAKALGVGVETSRLALILLAVALTSTATAAAGPIAFVALAAPQIAARLTRSAGVMVLPSALLGAVLLIASDLAAEHALPVALPVGVLTVVIGGAYLVWLLIHEQRRRARAFGGRP